MQIEGLVTCTMSSPHPQHAAPQRVKPALQVKSQLVPLQLGTELAGAAHEVHDAPQLFTEVSATHWPLQEWKPALHATPQAVPSQDAAPFAGTGQIWQLEPQLLTDVVDRHWPLHSW